MLLGTYKKYKIMTEKKDKTVLDVNSISCQELIDVLVQLDEDCSLKMNFMINMKMRISNVLLEPQFHSIIFRFIVQEWLRQ